MVLCLAAAEAAVRYIDGYAMFAMPLSAPTGSSSVSPAVLDSVPVAAGVERQWFYDDPPALANRRAVPEEWTRLFRAIEADPDGSMDFRPPDVFKAWNSVFAGPDPCKHPFLRRAPGVLWLYDPPDGSPHPPYRYLPNATLPNGLVTNQMGWRGAPIEDPRGPRTIRIVFVGSSTTMGAPHLPFSYPEFVGYWLNRWAKARGLDLRFEALNMGRESITSADSAAVVRTEILPLRPDLVVYYEGGNQFRPASVVTGAPKGATPKPPAAVASTSPSWLQEAARYSAVMARVQAAVGMAGTRDEKAGAEWPKPDYRFTWPEGLDEKDPDLAYPDLPVSLNEIENDLDRIRADLATVDSDFALSSFLWMVKDGMVLDPVRHKYILEQLNVANFPYRYRDMERLSNFQNRFLAKYARVHKLPFIDFARYVPLDPDLFVDAVHTNYAGLRLQAWVAFNQLLPTVEKHLADGSWPRPVDPKAPPLPTITPRRITLHCR
ncbi:hypothetical protein [Reyranella sp.]|uniref:hypothetical protein n=1 Tax=Reyranella sp. TaxID=1929291 RepID=UPI003BA9EE6F